MRTLDSAINSSDEDILYPFTQGIDVDRFLYNSEIRVQKAWAQALHDIQIFSKEELKQVTQSLDEIHGLMERDEFPWSVADEDIHMNIESYMTKKIGDLGKKIHLGRSRNDLIATTLRLHCEKINDSVFGELGRIVEAIQAQSKVWKGTTIPGMTHLQAGMPIAFSKVFSAHGEALKRDQVRVDNAKKSCLSYCPLGAAAFAGTHLPIDLKKLAQNLGFERELENSYDAVGDRDFILETLNAFAQIAVHLTRFCEETIYFSSTQVNLLELPKSLSTGSSIMPNKRNPDVLELIRAKMARVIAASNEGMHLVRVVVPSYGTDLHELKRTLMTSFNSLMDSLNILSPFIKGLTINQDVAADMLGQGHIFATEITNLFTTQGLSFREAYKKTADLVEKAKKENKQVHEVLDEPSRKKLTQLLLSKNIQLP